MIEVAELTTRPVPAVVPKLTTVAPVKPVPVTVTGVPPAVGPEVGLTPVTVGSGGAVKVNWSAGRVHGRGAPGGGDGDVDGGGRFGRRGDGDRGGGVDHQARARRGAELDHGGPGEAGAGDRDRGAPGCGPGGGAHAGDGGNGGGAPVEALRSTPTAVDTPAGDWVAVGATVPETVGS